MRARNTKSSRILRILMVILMVTWFLCVISAVVRQRALVTVLPETSAASVGLLLQKPGDQQQQQQGPTDTLSCPWRHATIIQMAAVPATASTSIDKFFKVTRTAWHKPHLSYEERGFVCADGEVVEYDNGDNPLNRTVSCLVSRFWTRRKVHVNYNALRANVPFTIFKQPYATLSSHFTLRKTWDAIYDDNDSANRNNMTSWIQRAWWRHNLFTKMLATDTQLLWTSPQQPESALTPTQNESDRENTLGEQSAWLHTAVARLEQMPIFGLHHRMSDTLALMEFRLCLPSSTIRVHPNKTRPAPTPDLVAVMERTHRLDVLLLARAESRFDAMMEDMQEKRGKGILCDLGFLLGHPDLEMGLKCQKKAEGG